MTLPPAAAAALGIPVPAPQPERVSWVAIEDPPKMIEIRNPEDGSPLGWYAQFDDDRLTDPMANKARSVCDVVDQNACEANGCENPIGWVLAGEADERTEWRAVTAVQHGRKVIATCAECSPDVVYDDLFD